MYFTVKIPISLSELMYRGGPFISTCLRSSLEIMCVRPRPRARRSPLASASVRVSFGGHLLLPPLLFLPSRLTMRVQLPHELFQDLLR